MKKTVLIILLAVLLLGALILPACKPPQPETEPTPQTETTDAATGVPASDTELSTTDEEAAGNTQNNN